MRILQQIVFICILIIFLAALPTVIEINPSDKNIDWKWEKFPRVYGEFIKEISSGSLGTYRLGLQERKIEEDISNNFFTSLSILFAGVHIAVLLSLIFGLFFSRFRLTRVVNLLLNILSAIPDFILIIFSMMAAVKIYKITGIRIISLRPEAGPLNIWFPMMSVAIAPSLYLFKLVAIKYYQVSGEDYIRTALAKGMRQHYINLQHVYKNIEPFILAELTKTVSLAIGNLFIVEYLLNVKGITIFIFQSQQFHPIAIGMFSLLLIALIVYFSVRLVLYLFKRGFLYE